MAGAAGRIADNYQTVQERISLAAAGRSVRLVCVTKYAEPAWVEALLAAGAAELGENLLPRAAERFAAWQAAGHSFARHLLGPQQSRKAALVPGSCDLFQALDREKFARLLQQELAGQSRTLDVLLEVNADAEAQKHGWLPGELPEALPALAAACPALQLRGLMAIPRQRQPDESAGAAERRLRATYSALRQLFDRIGPLLPRTGQWDTLSMGMSQDFTWAIAEGSTMVRVGSALFAGLEG
jgi:pyridoxal phosphate enzyme (YggS family)